MEVRSARGSDADLIAGLHATTAMMAYAHIYPPEAPFPMEVTRRRWREFRGRVLIAEERGRAVGFVAFDGEELHALYVLPEHWGRGIGGRLLELAGPVSSLWVLEGNAHARQFYERHGWRPDGAVQDAFGVPELRYRRARPVSPA